jgi:hypothetical protein
VPDRPIVREQQRISGDAGTPEDTGVLDDVHELANSADDDPVLAFIRLFPGRKRDL